MKSTIVVVVLLMSAFGAAAQETDPALVTEKPAAKEQAPKIDASPTKLLELLAETEEPPERPGRVEFHAGRIDVRAFGTRFGIGYLPIMPAFVGARFVGTKEWPDAFSMLGVQIPNTPQTWRRSRERNVELRRIERTSKVRMTVQVKGQ